MKIEATARKISEAVVEIDAADINLPTDMTDAETLRIVIRFTPENRRPSSRSIVVPMDYMPGMGRSYL